jgi:hypothetical protein
MPAAGKCRKGVFRMKKLLLVMLVPVLVLGVMSCGTKVPDGNPSPIGLQAEWEGSGDSVGLVIAGNQVTLISPSPTYVGNIALRTNYDGYKGTNDDGLFTNAAADGGTLTLEFFWFDTPYDKIGHIKADITAEDSFTVTEVRYNKYYQNVMLPAEQAVYTKK